jgi:hypothetical protein
MEIAPRMTREGDRGGESDEREIARSRDQCCRPNERLGPMAEDPVTRLVIRVGIPPSNLLEEASGS